LEGGDNLMFFWSVAEPCLTVLIAIILITQVILPPFINKPLFWFFRRSQRDLRKLTDIIAEEKDEVAKTELTSVIQDLRSKTRKSEVLTTDDELSSQFEYEDDLERLQRKRESRNKAKTKKKRKQIMEEE
jgi:membrane-associated HD superfamily phosphohydrolase